ncbi:DUF3857 domain-containing protein [bacterium]|nr:DUF3857 domain-containing protein [bacterium]
MRRIVVVVLLFVLLVGVVSAEYISDDYLSQSMIMRIIETAPEVTSADTNARFLYRRIHWNISASNSACFEEEVLLEILAEKAKHEYGDLKLSFDAANSVVEIIRVETILQDGTILPIMDGADNELIPPELVLDGVFGDHKMRIISFSGVETGAVIHWIIQHNTKYPRDNGFISESVAMQADIPINQLKVTISHPVTLPVHLNCLNGCVEPEKSILPGEIEYEWVMKNVPAIADEWGMPALNNLVSRCQFTTITNLSVFARWFQEKRTISETESVDSDNTIAEDHDKSKKAIINKCFRFVADDIRSVKVSPKQRCYKPSSANDILGRRFADTLDKGHLLQILLEENDISSDIVFFSGDRVRIDGEIISPEGFDSVVVVAQLEDGSEIWLDPMDRNNSPGWFFHGDVRGIRISADSARIVSLPVFPRSRSISQRRIEMTLDSAEHTNLYQSYGKLNYCKIIPFPIAQLWGG